MDKFPAFDIVIPPGPEYKAALELVMGAALAKVPLRLEVAIVEVRNYDATGKPSSTWTAVAQPIAGPKVIES